MKYHHPFGGLLFGLAALVVGIAQGQSSDSSSDRYAPTAAPTQAAPTQAAPALPAASQPDSAPSATLSPAPASASAAEDEREAWEAFARGETSAPANPLRGDVGAATGTGASNPFGPSDQGGVPTGPSAAVPNALTGRTLPPTIADTRDAYPSLSPSQLAQTLLQTPSSGQLAGVTVSLSESIRGSSQRQEQSRIARAYWDLSSAVAQYYLALREDSEIRGLARRYSELDNNWQLALADRQARLTATRSAAESAQYQLHRLLGNMATGSLPIPSDLPHAGRYETRYDEIFSGRPDRVALQLHELLPVTYSRLRAQASGVASANQELQALSQRGISSEFAAQQLASYELLALRRREFLSTLRDYNLQIADYIEVAAPGEVGSQRLVAMLIGSSGGRATRWERPGQVQTASNESEIPTVASARIAPSSDADAAPRTYGSGAQSRSVRRPILSGWRNREHSILVRPLRRLRERNND